MIKRVQQAQKDTRRAFVRFNLKARLLLNNKIYTVLDIKDNGFTLIKGRDIIKAHKSEVQLLTGRIG